MRQRHDYIVPFFNNQHRFDKPPLTYWAQLASYTVFGENDFAARLPSVVAAALTAVAIFGWGRRIADDRVGWWAAAIFTLSLQTFIHAKAAVADMWLVLFVTTGHWAAWELIGRSKSRTLNLQPSRQDPDQASSRALWWCSFYVSLALAFLAKGPIGWVPLLTVLATRIVYRDLAIAVRFKFLWGTIAMLGIISLWAVPALIRTGGEFFRVGIGHHVIGRSFSAMEGHGGASFAAYVLLLPFYFVTVFASFLPWSVKLPKLVRRVWRTRDFTDNYLALGVVIVFAIFTLVKTKLPHYTLPAFPLLALLLARQLGPWQMRFFRFVAGATAAVFLLIAVFVPPQIARFFPARDLFEQSRASLRANTQLASVEFAEPSLVWYFRGRVTTDFWMVAREDAADFMTVAGPRGIVLPAAEATAIFPQLPSGWKRFSTTGFNVAKGKRVDLVLVLKPD